MRGLGFGLGLGLGWAWSLKLEAWGLGLELPYPHPLALTGAGRRAVVSSVPTSILTGILTPRPSHHQCWSPSCRRVIRPRLYPHRYPHHHPHRCPHPPALTTSARHRAARVPKMHLVVASHSGRVSPVPPQSAATTRACRPACVFVVVAPREFGVAPRVLHARASKQATWKNTS